MIGRSRAGLKPVADSELRPLRTAEPFARYQVLAVDRAGVGFRGDAYVQETARPRSRSARQASGVDARERQDLRVTCDVPHLARDLAQLDPPDEVLRSSER